MKGNNKMSCLARKFIDYCQNLTWKRPTPSLSQLHCIALAWVLLLLGHQAKATTDNPSELRKKKSTSTLRRHLRLREEHLKKKAHLSSETHFDQYIEKSSENPVQNSEVIEEATDTSEHSSSFKCETLSLKTKLKMVKWAHSKNT